MTDLEWTQRRFKEQHIIYDLDTEPNGDFVMIVYKEFCRYFSSSSDVMIMHFDIYGKLKGE